MGCFSWKFSDDRRSRLKCGRPGYLLTPDNGVYYTAHYSGYGDFGGQDVYELVARWNKDNLTEDYLIKPLRSSYMENRFYEKALERYEYSLNRMLAYREMERPAFLKLYGEEAEREVGIDIACYDEQNARLKYPIKIVSKPCDYASVPYSKSDPMQGCD